ncbi:MAG: glycosyltransferase family protein [Anaerolineales bacterium]|nr:glycosyltransferase family protein [Anaerolineales bacterium]
MDHNIVAIIQARMGSSRLPGKVLKPLGDKNALEWMLVRLGRSTLINQVVIATTDDPGDDLIQTYCEEHGVPCFRGSMFDVLDRIYYAAKLFQADVVIRLTGDCPFIDPEMLDSNLKEFLSAEPPLDFAANRLPPPFTRTIPIGLDAEYCTMTGLEKVWKEADQKHQREHVMPYFYENTDIFNIKHIENTPNYGEYRWTLDTPEDLVLLQKITELFPGRDDFSWLEILEKINEHPEITLLNENIHHKDYREVDERI